MLWSVLFLVHDNLLVILLICYSLVKAYKHFYNRQTGDVSSCVNDPYVPSGVGANGSRYPFTSYPKGWFRVSDTQALKQGQVLPLKYFGHDFVLYRGVDGKARVFDAFCPHLGAHLGYGGKVVNNCLQCPFHAWEFGPGGNCTNIPYSNSIPPQAKLNSWISLEKNGIIWLWFPGEGNEQTVPEFEFPEVEPVQDSWNWKLLRWRWVARVHVQEVAENAVDVAHFNVVHAYDEKPRISDFTVEGPVFSVNVLAKRTLYKVWQAVNDTYIQYFGMGVVHARVDVDYINTMVILTSTPIDREYSEINIYFRFKKTWNFLRTWVISWYVPYHVGCDFYCDIPVWENKVYRTEPMMCKGDGPISAIRRWARQFYGRQTQEISMEEEGSDCTAVFNKQTNGHVINLNEMKW